jgi:hypothetical protein
MATTKTLSVAQLLVLTTAAQRPDHMVLPLPAGLRAHGAVQRKLLTSLLKLGLVEERSTEDQALSWRRDEQGHCHALRITAAGLEAIGGTEPGEAEIDNVERAAPPTQELGAEEAQPVPGVPGAPTTSCAPAPEYTEAPEIGGAPAPGTTGPRATPGALAGEVPTLPTGSEAPAAPANAAVRPGGKLGRILDAVAAEGGATLGELVALTGWQPHTARAAVTRLRQRGFDLRMAVAEGRKAYRLLRAVQA